MHRDTHTYSPMHTHIQHTQRYKHTHAHACTESHKYIYTDTAHTHTTVIHAHTHIHTYTAIHIHPNTHEYTYTRKVHAETHAVTHTHTHTHTESWERQHMDATPTFPILQACLFKLLSTFRNGISKALQKAWRSRNHTSCPQGILIWEEDTHTLMNTDKAAGSKVSYDVSEVRCVR